jgi:flavin reductase (DIM6/NTAB) family NADH-FMN oxidoreductase RutF
VVEGAAAYLECEVRTMVDAGGDHDVVIAEVVNAGVMKPGKAEETLTLLDLGWNYAG